MTRLLGRLARRALHAADNACAGLSSGKLPAGGSLVAVTFHAICASGAEPADSSLGCTQQITADDLRRFLDLMLRSGLKPVSPPQLDQGLVPGAHYLMVTFDDGYFNNTRALDVLDEFGAPATFFISSAHIIEGKAFWWDALARELRLCGASEHAIETETRRMKLLDHGQIEIALRARFGCDVLRPRSELDRPFGIDEFRDFARHRWVHIGNHTRDHAILPNCSPEEMRRQIDGCQADLASLTGQRPITIAYPNGDYSRDVVQAARAAGLRIGLTVRPRVNPLAMDSDKARMTLGRHLVYGGEDVALQCRKIMAGFIPGNLLKTLMMSAY